jgi:hypothetical protein
MVKRPSPERAATAALRRFRTFPLSPRNGEVRRFPDIRSRRLRSRLLGPGTFQNGHYGEFDTDLLMAPIYPAEQTRRPERHRS